MKTLFIFAGEPSGDLHGSRLIQALRDQNPALDIETVSGPLMRAHLVNEFLPMEEFQVMGFVDVIKSLPRLYNHFRCIKKHLLKKKPDILILIDYPGFNLRLAKSLRKSGYLGQIVQFICPTIWAHGHDRIHTLTNSYDLLLTIYPFEHSYFDDSKLIVKYIGNPLVNAIQQEKYQAHWKEVLSIPENRPLIALFPGSRRGEIHRHLPMQLQAAALLKEKHPEIFIGISCANENTFDFMCSTIQTLYPYSDIAVIPPKYLKELQNDCMIALAKSGTVTLELAIHKKPTVVHYDVSWINYAFAKWILRLNLPHYCIVNILENKRIFPELIGVGFSGKDLYDGLDSIYSHPDRQDTLISDCNTLCSMLGNFDSYTIAAKTILELNPC